MHPKVPSSVVSTYFEVHQANVLYLQKQGGKKMEDRGHVGIVASATRFVLGIVVINISKKAYVFVKEKRERRV